MEPSELKCCGNCGKVHSSDEHGVVVCMPEPGKVSTSFQDTPAGDMDCYEENKKDGEK